MRVRLSILASGVHARGAQSGPAAPPALPHSGAKAATSRSIHSCSTQASPMPSSSNFSRSAQSCTDSSRHRTAARRGRRRVGFVGGSCESPCGVKAAGAPGRQCRRGGAASSRLAQEGCTGQPLAASTHDSRGGGAPPPARGLSPTALLRAPPCPPCPSARRWPGWPCLLLDQCLASVLGLEWTNARSFPNQMHL